MQKTQDPAAERATPLTLEQSLDMTIEHETKNAVRILSHYFRLAMPDLGSDTEAEMRDVVTSIVDIALLTAQKHKLVHLRPHHGDTKISGRAEITPTGRAALDSNEPA